ncbi:MAG: cache domain-containing protein [Bacteroidota bacterium]|nr:cache domain-containing protein [Bacteroidota bacterium]
MRLSIQRKLMVSILGTVVVVYFVAFAYIFTVMENEAHNNSVELTKHLAVTYANSVRSKLNKDFAVTSSFAASMSQYPELDAELRDKIYRPAIKKLVTDNTPYISVWYSWELNAIDPNYNKSFGRVRNSYFRQGNRNSFRIDSLELDGEALGSTYYNLKMSPRPILVNPYYDNYTGRVGDSVQMTTIAIPIQHKSKFAGLTGIDINIDYFQRLTESITPTKNSKAFIISGNGNFVAFSGEDDMINTSFSEYFSESDSVYTVQEYINAKSQINFNTQKNNTEYLVSILPMEISGAEINWAIGIMQPTKEIFSTVKSSTYTFLLVSLVGLFIIILIIWSFSKRITSPLSEITNFINLLAQGDLRSSNKLTIYSHDEIGDIAESANVLLENLNKTAKFAREIGKGNLNYEFNLPGKNDELGNSLLKMRESLNQAENERKVRETADRKLNWVNEGTAKFANIIRETSDDLEVLAYTIISELVEYIGANQGGIFIVNDDNKKDIFIELTASYAYNRRKYSKKKMPYNVGLPGRCVQEAETIYMEKIPNDYLQITSGLGEENPNILLLTPMIFEEEVLGVLELASFKTIEKHKIEFVETISQSIASSISRSKINIRTSKLLRESQIKSKEMASQEEEIRQNMEEMKSSQEELTANVTELDNTFEAIKQVALVVEFDMEGRITEINDQFLDILKLSRQNVVGQYQGSFSTEKRKLEEFNAFWDQLKNGMIKSFKQDIDTESGVIRIKGSYTPVKNSDGKIYKVINIAQVL